MNLIIKKRTVFRSWCINSYKYERNRMSFKKIGYSSQDMIFPSIFKECSTMYIT